MSQSAKPYASQGNSGSEPRYGWARAAGEGVQGYASAVFARAGFADPTLLLRWKDIVGPEVARITRPLKWQEGPDGAVLSLKCEAGSAVLLQHQTRALTERLNSYLGAGRITRIRLVTGRLSDGPEVPSHPAPQPPAPAKPKDLQAALARFGALRGQLKKTQSRRPD